MLTSGNKEKERERIRSKGEGARDKGEERGSFEVGPVASFLVSELLSQPILKSFPLNHQITSESEVIALEEAMVLICGGK